MRPITYICNGFDHTRDADSKENGFNLGTTWGEASALPNLRFFF